MNTLESRPNREPGFDEDTRKMLWVEWKHNGITTGGNMSMAPVTAELKLKGQKYVENEEPAIEK